MMKGMIVEAHKQDCGGLYTVAQGHWDHPWMLARYKRLGRERTGKPHRGAAIKFLVYRCGDPHCPAALIFLAETLERDLGIRPRTLGVKETELDYLWHDSQREMTWEWIDAD